MDLLSLPQEMLASVCKYSDVLTLAKCRKLSSRIDKVAIRYNLNHLKLKTLAFILKDEHIEIVIETCDGYKTTVFFAYLQEGIEASLVKCVERYISAVRYIEVLKIGQRSTTIDFVLNNEFFNVLLKNSRNKVIRRLNLWFIHIDANGVVLQNFLRVFKSNAFGIRGCIQYKEDFFERLCSGLSLKFLRSSKNRIYLNISDLRQLCLANIPQSLKIDVQLSLKEVVEFLMDISRENKQIHYEFYNVSFDNMSKDEVMKLVEPLKIFDPAKGTWLAMNENGKIGNLLSITQPAAMKRSDAPSRGAHSQPQ